MLSYKYTARNSITGERVKAAVQAQSEQDAFKLIKKSGLVPIEIKLSDEGLGGAFGNKLKRVATKDKVLFSRQLSTLINAGLPIVQSLRSVSEQTTSKPLKVVINSVVSDVEAGASLSAAMAKHPKIFNAVYVSLVAAGETSGTLDSALERLAIQQEKDADLVSKVRGAMAYPAIVVVVMIAVVGFILIKVLPQVEILYSGLPGASLPFITVALLKASHFAVNFWWLIIVIAIALVIGGTRFGRTIAGKRVYDKFKMKSWPVGTLFMKMYMARFSRTASTLVASGVPLLQVLEITAKAVNNVWIEDSIKKAIEKVKGGKSLSDAIGKDPNFLPLVPNMLKIGEQSGSMEQMLGKAADYYEREVDNEVKNISSIIEPVMMIILGVVAFVIVAAILLPIYGLAGQSFVQV